MNLQCTVISALAMAALTAAPRLEAQQPIHVVVPAANAGVEGSARDPWVSQAVAARRQVLVDGSQLAALAGKDLTALEVRRDGGETSAFREGKVWLEISLSNLAVTVDRAARSFASNRGVDHTLVFHGYVTFPAAPRPAAAPAPWQAPHSVRVALTTPFRYTGRTLCIEVVTRLAAPQDPLPIPPWFLADAERRAATGAATRYGVTCMTQMLPDPAGGTAATMALGSTARFNLRAAKSQGVVLFALGFTPLDVPLDAAGAPGCSVLVDWISLTPRAITAIPGVPAGYAAMDLPLPVLPSLAGGRLFTQWLAIEPANALGLTLSNGVAVTLGRPHDLGTALVESHDLAATDGVVWTDRVPVLRLEGRSN